MDHFTMMRDHDRAVTNALRTIRHELMRLAIAATEGNMPKHRGHSNWSEAFDATARNLAEPGLLALAVVARCLGKSLAGGEIPPAEGEEEPASNATEH